MSPSVVDADLEKRFLDKLILGDDCWTLDKKPRQHGYVTIDRREGGSREKGIVGQIRAYYGHRLAYELFVGQIPDGHIVHHVCKHRACVRYDHLTTMTQSDHMVEHNTLSHCPRCGDERIPENLRQSGACKRCSREYRRQVWAEQKK